MSIFRFFTISKMILKNLKICLDWISGLAGYQILKLSGRLSVNQPYPIELSGPTLIETTFKCSPFYQENGVNPPG